VDFGVQGEVEAGGIQFGTLFSSEAMTGSHTVAQKAYS